MLKKEDVLHIADLAKLSLDDNQCNLYPKDLNEIIEFVSEISDLPDVIEKGIPSEFESLRKDFIKQEIKNEELISNAPESENGYFSVSKVIADA